MYSSVCKEDFFLAQYSTVSLSYFVFEELFYLPKKGIK